uniref:Uncharacterized protein n=1 Tax=Anopheles funestus TaxID=62324 RepID=A0A182S4E6_ANOFN
MQLACNREMQLQLADLVHLLLTCIHETVNLLLYTVGGVPEDGGTGRHCVATV